MDKQAICDLAAYYREQGAPQDQQMLIALLRETQAAEGGLLTQEALDVIAQAYGLKRAVLTALIRRIPGLRCESAPHRLEVCGTCRAGAKLREGIEQRYRVRSGDCNEQAGFSYRVTPCMKNCRFGPSIRWDGQLYPHADMALVQRLIEGKAR